MATIAITTNEGALDSASAVLEVTATNPEYNQPALHIIQKGTVGGAASIRIDDPNPDIEFVETGQAPPAGKYEIAVQSDKLQTPPSLPGAEALIRSCEYLIIRDFGVDWRHVKPTAISEPLFQFQLFRFETNKKLVFRIVGYSDCVGVEANNFLLRRGRAMNVFKLLGSSARSRVMAVTTAPPATFLTDNSTVAARANTRAVVIEVFINGSAII